MRDSFLKRFGRTILAVLAAFLLATCGGGGGGGGSGVTAGGGGGSNCAASVPTSFTQWSGTKQLGVAGQDTWANAIAVDANDNVYVAGITRGALDCVAITSGAAAFLTKYDSAGNRLFTRLLNSTVPDFAASDAVEAQALAVDTNGNVYVAGYTFTGADGNVLIGLQDFFLTKYDSLGNKVFTKELGVAGAYTEAFAVAVDSVNGRVYVAGDTDGGLDKNVLTGVVDYFFTAYDLDGNYQFTIQNGVAGSNSTINAATLDASGNLYLAGGTTGGLINAVTGTQDFFLLKFAVGGISTTTRTQLGVSAASTYAAGVAVDPSGNNLYVTGATYGGLDGQILMGTEDLFLTQYIGGTKVGTKLLGVNGADTYATGIALGASGNVNVTGWTYGGLDGNTLSSPGSTDFFLTMYDSSSNKILTKQLGVAGAITYANGVATDSLGNVYVVGGTSGGLDGNTVTGTTDLFIAKYDPSGNKQ